MEKEKEMIKMNNILQLEKMIKDAASRKKFISDLKRKFRKKCLKTKEDFEVMLRFKKE